MNEIQQKLTSIYHHFIQEYFIEKIALVNKNIIDQHNLFIEHKHD